jgi:hypothetical protein
MSSIVYDKVRTYQTIMWKALLDLGAVDVTGMRWRYPASEIESGTLQLPSFRGASLIKGNLQLGGAWKKGFIQEPV